ncbi:unnamed protein product [Cercopithifilaria johnstoni]|uniref:COMM domain-containing protein n=1 Tax=Cercopithifilaria johnstoni TaxID=2874296 RepID=A0A8J2MA58_9BILA|nr:unnamed protein product [Cercopithifilaria johnstoni]
MDVNLNPDLITEAWRSIRMRVPLDQCMNVDAKSMKELFSVLEELNRLSKQDDPNSVLECSNFSELNKQHMIRLWRAKADDDDIKWGIDVVVANSNIRKSLHPKVWLVVDGQEIEMNLEMFAKLRFEVSRALSRIDRYS